MHTAIPGKPSLVDLGDIEVEAVVEIGRARLSLRAARTLKVGDVVALEQLAGEAVRVTLNGQPFAAGETVCATNVLCVRLTHLAPPPETH